jgi:hypothetical protein
MPARVLAGLLALITLLCAAQSFVLYNEGILPQKTVEKIDEIGGELRQKTGVSLYLAAVQKMPTQTIKEFEAQIARDLEPPYILLAFSRDDHKVDIINSPDTDALFDKEQVLSPFPWSGSIIPLLESHSKNQKAAIEAALLNGYADIAEQVAAAKGVELKSGLGNTNRNIYLGLRILFYAILAAIFFNYLYRRFAKR